MPWVGHNLYDDPAFFAAYRQLDRSRLGLAGAPEWPAVEALLPAVAGARVVDLGCGFGAFARWAAAAGATEVLALDGSARMLERAQALTDDPRVRFDRIDLGELTLPATTYDLAYSALVVHYLDDITRFARSVHAALRPGGRFVLTTEHPVFMASTRADFADVDGRRAWPVDHYADEGEITTDWLMPGVRKFFRSVGTTVNALIDAGFVIQRLVEWTPSVEQVAADPRLAPERDRPAFLLIAADRPASESTSGRRDRLV
jgi:SAM-dependent methyltransferase